jgi:hypothetical protein
MSHGGKGDSPRPFSVDQQTYANNWELTFGKKKKTVDDNDINAYNDERLVSKHDKQQMSLPRDSEQGG